MSCRRGGVGGFEYKSNFFFLDNKLSKHKVHSHRKYENQIQNNKRCKIIKWLVFPLED